MSTSTVHHYQPLIVQQIVEDGMCVPKYALAQKETPCTTRNRVFRFFFGFDQS